MAIKRQREAPGASSASKQDASIAAEWSRLLGHLGPATGEYPGLFPNGITKIELEVGADKVRCLVEGPTSSHAQSFASSIRRQFEFGESPETLVTKKSPVAGDSSAQSLLHTGKTIEGAAKVFNRDCIGKVSGYANNCAHYLTDALIEAGFDELAQSSDCVTSGGRCAAPYCASGGRRWIRAKDVNCWFLLRDASPRDSVALGTGFFAVYQERQSDGQGHVVILDANAWTFYGTGWYESGLPSPNDWKHQYYQW